MSDTVSCPSCKRTLRVPDNLHGHDVKCPACETTFRAGQTEPEAPPAPRRPEPRYEEDDRPRRRDRDEDDRSRDRPSRRDRDEDEDRSRDRPRRRPLTPHRGALILIMGLLSIFVFAIPFGQIAWIMGNQDMREIRAGRMDPEGEGMTQVGRILGIISTILCLLALLGVCLIFGIFLIAAGTSGR
jgi:hypothetical protein